VKSLLRIANTHGQGPASGTTARPLNPRDAKSSGPGSDRFGLGTEISVVVRLRKSKICTERP
jgi:hypothetical protein